MHSFLHIAMSLGDVILNLQTFHKQMHTTLLTFLSVLVTRLPIKMEEEAIVLMLNWSQIMKKRLELLNYLIFIASRLNLKRNICNFQSIKCSSFHLKSFHVMLSVCAKYRSTTTTTESKQRTAVLLEIDPESSGKQLNRSAFSFFRQ